MSGLIKTKIKVALIICLAASTMVACLAGCSAKVQVQHSGKVSGALEPGDGLTVVLDYVSGSPEKAAKLETRLSGCVQQGLRKAGWPAKFIPPDEFRRLLFPDLDITLTPRSAESLVSLLKAPQFRHKIDSLRLRYMVVIKEETWLWEDVDERGNMVPVGFPYLATLFTHKKSTDLTASIIDLKSGSETGVVSDTAESTAYYGHVLIMPIILPAVTESTACQRLGREVVKFISSKAE